MPTYTSQYPPAHSDTYVKSTTHLDVNYWAYFATDPAKSLTGSSGGNSWLGSNGAVTNQRFHIDLGSAKIIKNIYYENQHVEGGATDRGVNNFTLWGSNTGAGSFDDLVWGNDEGWTELTVAQNTFDEHIGLDQADPKYIVVTNAVAYRYYAFKFADNHGHSDYLGVRRIELQTKDAVALISTAVITSSITSSLSRGVKEALISTSNIATSITGRLTKIITLVSASAIATSITATLGRGITEALTSTADIVVSISGILSRGITAGLNSTSNIAVSITGSLSRGITQALASVVSVVTFVTGRLTRPTVWTKIVNPITTWTTIENPVTEWTEWTDFD